MIKFVNAEYKDITPSTLRSWLRYWEGVAAGTRRLTPGSKDTVEMAPGEVAKLRAEIAAREALPKTGQDAMDHRLPGSFESGKRR